MIHYKGHRVIVTGASSGIGRELSIRLSKEDNTVVLCGRSFERLEETRTLMEQPDRHMIVPFDFLSGDDCSEIFEKAMNDGNECDGMVYCAGMAPVTPLRSITQRMIEDVFTVNYTSFMCMVRDYAKKEIR